MNIGLHGVVWDIRRYTTLRSVMHDQVWTLHDQGTSYMVQLKIKYLPNFAYKYEIKNRTVTSNLILCAVLVR